MISTHTLTWSVTTAVLFHAVQLIISTHTLTWSVTQAEVKTAEEMKISTHTLTWSVTGTEVYNGGNQIFQLTRSRVA